MDSYFKEQQQKPFADKKLNCVLWFAKLKFESGRKSVAYYHKDGHHMENQFPTESVFKIWKAEQKRTTCPTVEEGLGHPQCVKTKEYQIATENDKYDCDVEMREGAPRGNRKRERQDLALARACLVIAVQNNVSGIFRLRGGYTVNNNRGFKEWRVGLLFRGAVGNSVLPFSACLLKS